MERRRRRRRRRERHYSPARCSASCSSAASAWRACAPAWPRSTPRRRPPASGRVSCSRGARGELRCSEGRHPRCESCGLATGRRILGRTSASATATAWGIFQGDLEFTAALYAQSLAVLVAGSCSLWLLAADATCCSQLSLDLRSRDSKVLVTDTVPVCLPALLPTSRYSGSPLEIVSQKSAIGTPRAM